MRTDLADLPVHVLSAEIAAGRLSSSELVGHYLERIGRLDPKLKSFIAVYDQDARRAAEAADLTLRAGHRIGPFHGIPIALKDVINVEGRVTTGGSKMWLNRVAQNTATVVKKLLGAGMILLGKNHTVEFTMGGWGTNQQLGTPWNPWNADTHLCPGGSSSGSAVAVGARLAPWAIGTDTGGSVRLPAAYCGGVGLKTTLGRISSHGILPMSQTLDSPGVLTRSVEDAALLYQLLHGPDPLDPPTLRHPADDPLPDLKRGVRGLRIGVLPPADREGLDAEVLAAYDASVEALASQGARKIEIALPMRLTAYGNLAGVIITTEVYANYREFVDRPELPLDEYVRVRVLAGKNRLAVDYLDALRDREAKKAQFESLFQSMDVLLTPTGLEPPIPLEAIDENILPGMLTRWVGFIGLPALAVPNGFTQSGLPISLQIVGRSHDEATILRVGWAYEQAHSWRDRRPPARMSQESRKSILPGSPTAGMARLSIVVLVTVVSLIYSSVLEYGVPLYFNSLGNFPKKMWSSLVVWQVLPWILTPVLAGVLAKRFGECRVWAVSLVGQAIIPPALILIPHPWIIPPLAFWSGVTGAAAWLSGISLTQVVPPEKKGFANAMMMMSVGVGSVVGPLAARGILWSHQISGLASRGDWLGIGAFLLNFTPPHYNPSTTSFSVIFMGIGVLSLLMAVAVWMYGQHGGGAAAGVDAPSTPTRADFGRLFSNPSFWGLVLSLSLLGGPVFEACNQFLRYRSEDLGLITGPIDHGWILMELMRPLMWLPGGLAVGLLAGKRAPGYVAAFIFGCYGLASLGIGLSHSAVALFGTVAVFEFLRQCMRWAQTGYFSEHMPADLRATAMGWGIALSATGGSIFGFVTNSWMTADAVGFDSARPFELAALLGLIGATGLFIFDRISPIRRGIKN